MKAQIHKWIIITQDFSGLGWAKLIKEQTDDEVLLAVNLKEDDEKADFAYANGDGVVDKMEFSSIFKNRAKFDDYGWVFDANHSSDQAETLRTEGFMVFGGHTLTDKMEHDREYGLSLIEKAGMTSPESHEFSDIYDAIEFLEQNPDKAYVFKPDERHEEEGWDTTAPDNEDDEEANEEMRQFLLSMNEGNGDFILQERKKGVEINVEYFLYDGKPIFAHANFECKKKYDKDMGNFCGCSQDIEFKIPIHAKVLRDTLDKLIALPEFKHHTGMIDGNFIVSDNEYWFLEFCGRFGYNASPNLFMNLGLKPFSVILSDWMTGNVENFDGNFRSGFGATVSFFIEKPIKGIPIIFKKDALKKFFPYDLIKEDDGYSLSGYSGDIGFVGVHDYDIKSATEGAVEQMDTVHFPGRFGRTDFSRTDYPSNPLERYQASVSMKLFDN
jgi:phosphoribosylamine-glycine ligase